jgi:CelD/BcsL family acetyltransferase involved in cellulose biosynthesis
MGCHQLIHITSIDEFRTAAPSWDNLWWRSEVTIPTARAELLAQWVEQFAPQADFHALAVENQGKWVAAMLMVRVKIGRVLDVGAMPVNAWAPGGGLLLDANTETDVALDILVAAIRGFPWQWLWLDDVPLNALSWKAFQRAISRAGMASDILERYQVGLIKIDRNWEACRKHWSRSHRQSMAKAARRLAKEGDVDFQMYSMLRPEEVEPLLHKGFEVEDRSWKGEAGSSVFKRGMFGILVQQAKQLAKWGQLELSFLELNARPIAFSYGFNAKGVHHPNKIAYDPEYAHFSPGQLLFYHILERLYHDPERRAIDCSGEMSEATSRWRPTTYTIGQLVVAPRRLLGRMSLYVYKHCWPYVRHLRRRFSSGQRRHSQR